MRRLARGETSTRRWIFRAPIRARAVAQIAAGFLVPGTTGPSRRRPLFAVISVLLWSLAQWGNFALGYNIGWNVCTAALFVVLAAFAGEVSMLRLLIALAAAVV